VLYDGTCGLCHGLVRFILERDRREVFRFATLESAAAEHRLARFGGSPHRLTAVHVIAYFEGPSPALLVKSRAALFIFSALGWPWRVAALLGWLPTRWLDGAYDLIARNRHRIAGRRGCPTSLYDDASHVPAATIAPPGETAGGKPAEPRFER
jgi:predicted DCC family thiol-disulfide oxidoreductase YuxK